VVRGLIVTIVASLAASVVLDARRGATAGSSETSPILERFLSLGNSSPTEYRALRRLDARNGPQRSAWMDVWTELDPSGAFRYTVAAEGGSGYIRSKIFLGSLESERKLYASGATNRAALTSENYLFEELTSVDGLSTIAVTPRRKDVLLIDGAIYLQPEDADLVRIEGRLSKAPSFWIRQVQIVRSYKKIAGSRLPVALDATASIRLAGKAALRMTYEYERVNGQQVGTPQPRTTDSD
jgi:hypothetical protein